MPSVNDNPQNAAPEIQSLLEKLEERGIRFEQNAAKITELVKRLEKLKDDMEQQDAVEEEEAIERQVRQLEELVGQDESRQRRIDELNRESREFLYENWELQRDKFNLEKDMESAKKQISLLEKEIRDKEEALAELQNDEERLRAMIRDAMAAQEKERIEVLIVQNQERAKMLQEEKEKRVRILAEKNEQLREKRKREQELIEKLTVMKRKNKSRKMKMENTRKVVVEDLQQENAALKLQLEKVTSAQVIDQQFIEKAGKILNVLQRAIHNITQLVRGEDQSMNTRTSILKELKKIASLTSEIKSLPTDFTNPELVGYMKSIYQQIRAVSSMRLQIEEKARGVEPENVEQIGQVLNEIAQLVREGLESP